MYASLGRADRNPPTSVFSKPTLKRKLLKCGMSGESRPSLFSIDRKVELTEQLRLIDPFAVGKGERSQLFSLQRQRKGAKTARGLAMSGPTNRFVSLSGPGFAFVSAPPTLSPPPQLAVALEAQIALGKGKIERFGVLTAIEVTRVAQTLSGMFGTFSHRCIWSRRRTRCQHHHTHRCSARGVLGGAGWRLLFPGGWGLTRTAGECRQHYSGCRGCGQCVPDWVRTRFSHWRPPASLPAL